MPTILMLMILLLAWWLPVQAGTINLAWNPSPGATTYRLYYGVSPGSYPTMLDTGAATSASVGGLVEGTLYFFVATALNEWGESDDSNEVSALVSMPAVKVLAIHAGGPQVTASDGTVYLADQGFSGGQTHETTARISGTVDDALYRTERHGTFTYNFPMPNGTYLVTLKFAEIYWNQRNRRIFDVFIENTPAISNLDLYAEVGRNRAYDRTFSVQVSDGVLSLRFSPDRDQAKVSAIKIVSQ